MRELAGRRKGEKQCEKHRKTNKKQEITNKNTSICAEVSKITEIIPNPTHKTEKTLYKHTKPT